MWLMLISAGRQGGKDDKLCRCMNHQESVRLVQEKMLLSLHHLLSILRAIGINVARRSNETHDLVGICIVFKFHQKYLLMDCISVL